MKQYLYGGAVVGDYELLEYSIFDIKYYVEVRKNNVILPKYSKAFYSKDNARDYALKIYDKLFDWDKQDKKEMTKNEQ